MKPPEADSAVMTTETPRIPFSSVPDRKPPLPCISFSFRIGSPGRNPTRAIRPETSLIVADASVAVMKPVWRACSGHACQVNDDGDRR